jgi:pimeloyl-ACP methyl ester carboxylesterase
MIKSKTIKINKKEVSYYDEGKGETIIFIHGWIVSKEIYLPLIELMQKKYRVIAPDLPGFGDSDELESEHTLDSFVVFIQDFVNQLKIKKYHLYGYSMGGAIVIKLAFNNKSVDSVILQSTLYFSKQLPFPFCKINLKIPLRLLLSANFFQKILINKLVTYTVKTRVPTLLEHCIQEDKNHVFEVCGHLVYLLNHMSMRATIESGTNLLEVDLRNILRKTTNKTLILWGKKDIILSVGKADHLHSLLPNSTLVKVPKTSHDMVIERPDIVSKTIQAFLKSKL